jgi:hypothetical protein
MKRLYTILFALFVSFYSSAQCTDPSASNYNLFGILLSHSLNDAEVGPGGNQCCYDYTILVSSLQNVHVQINGINSWGMYGPLYYGECVSEGVYDVEVIFPEGQFSQVAFHVSDGQEFSVNSDMGSPYNFQINIGNSISGCMDPGACDYNPSATAQMYPCDYSCQGCLDLNAINYDPDATMDSELCAYLNYTIVGNAPFYWSYLLEDFSVNTYGESLPVIGSSDHSAIVPGIANCSCVYLSFLDFEEDHEVTVYNENMEIVFSDFMPGFYSGPVCYNENGVTIGCTNPAACNYDPSADCASYYYCDFTSCHGCTNPQGFNYSPQATIDDGSCCLGDLITFDFLQQVPDETPVTIQSYTNNWVELDGEDVLCFDGGCINIYDYSLHSPITVVAYRSDGSILFECSSQIDDWGYHNLYYSHCENDISGCVDPFGCNYNPQTNVWAPCDYSCHGCTDPSAPNYNPLATVENNTCCYDSWLTLEFSEPCYWYIYNPLTGMYMEGNYPENSGYCSDQALDPFTWGMPVVDDHAQISGSRFIADCYILEAISLSGNPIDFTITDGNGIVIASSTGNTNPILNADVSENTDEEPGCTDPIACNYDINASCNNGSCIYDCGGCTDINALNFNSNASWDNGSCQYTIQSPVVTYTTSPATLPNHFMIEFNVQELGNSLEYILSSDYNTSQRMVDEYTTYEMGPYPCDVAISFKMRSLDFNLAEAWNIEDIQILCSSLSVDETRTESSFGFYPNPANDRIMLTGLAVEQYTLQIIDIAGRVALNQTIIGNAAGVEVDLNNLQSGAYIVRVFNDAGAQSARLILEGN